MSAFTSQKKAKDFLHVLRGKVPDNAVRLFPCTLKEWFDWQRQKKWPDLTIDPDPQQLRDYPLHVGAEGINSRRADTAHPKSSRTGGVDCFLHAQNRICSYRET